MKRYIGILLLVVVFGVHAEAQHMAFGAKGGLLVGTQQGKRALLSYHTGLFFEGMGKWQGENIPRRVGYQIQLGYHRRGASYNSGFLGPGQSFVINDLFHNFSLAVLLKGNFQLKKNFLPYYMAGLRLDITPPDENFYQINNAFEQSGVQAAMFGLTIGGGIEWEPKKLPFGLFIELNVSPDLTPQIFYPKGQLVVYRPFGSNSQQQRMLNEDYKIINVSIEVTFGVKFLMRNDEEPEDK